MRLAVAAIASCLLAACAGVPQRTAAPSDADSGGAARSESAAKPPAPAPAQPSTSRSGGYYKDDGPGDNPPANLEDLPDAQPRAEPLHRYANEPYVALGQSYTPAKELVPYRQRGLASWYGRMFHGKKTSSGEPYDMYAMTGAHPTLPIPSYARVTNLGNGKSVVVRINDRGPFHPGRVIDLSYAAATRLGYVSKGHARVEVESVLPEEDQALAARTEAPAARAAPPARGSSPAAPPPTPAVAAAEDPIAALARASDASQDPSPAAAQPGAASPAIFVQLGAFRSSDKAEGLRARVRREIAGLAERLLIDVSNGIYRLHIGPYGSIDDARAIAARLGSALGLKAQVIRRPF